MFEGSKTKKFIKIGASIMIGVGLGVLILAGLGIGEDWLEPGSNPVESSNLPDIGAKAPDFELMSLKGERIRLGDHQGDVVLINFWATWCGPCRVEMPILQTYSQRYEDDLVILAVNAEESQDTVKGFVTRMGLTFDVLLDPEGKIQRLYQLRGYPTSFFVDKEGILQAQHVGMLTENQLKDYLLQVGVPK